MTTNKTLLIKRKKTIKKPSKKIHTNNKKIETQGGIYVWGFGFLAGVSLNLYIIKGKISTSILTVAYSKAAFTLFALI